MCFITVFILLIAIIIYLIKTVYFKSKTTSGSKPIVTFVIPSIGRPTIIRTIKSLQNLTNPNWKAIVVFDGVHSNIDHIKDNRIQVYKIEKSGKLNMGGATRNYGIDKVTNTEWVGFVDDDDTLAPHYIDKLLLDSRRNPTADCLVFRMYDRDRHKIVPLPHSASLKKGSVGISFCVKTNIIKNHKFVNNQFEDFHLLKQISSKHNILLSQNITYFVKENPIEKIYKRTLTPFINPIVEDPDEGQRPNPPAFHSSKLE